MSAENPNSVVVAIDTTDYSGNFEREMCAFLTGVVGDCCVGDELTEEALEEIPERELEWITTHIVHESDEHGLARPTSIWTTPGWYCNGMGGHYRDDPSTEAQAAIDLYKSLEAYHGAQLKMANDRLESGDFEAENDRGAWTKEACEQTKKRIEAVLNEAKQKKAPHKWPAYLSVAIFFDEIPPKEVMDVLIERAKLFASHRPDWESYNGKKKELTITSVRVLEPELVKPRKINHTEVARYEV